ncbi:MAG: hypothetical protein KKC76_06080 [Proteobacteria bacterium]|nr:hypothetical protein [Pseudomonadota bacterium]MBU4295544.1 hypothetical protein [Pseudomonadota bacterium]MCG2748420.1 hypothetical protein [Desulfobulbaceae bacterium]
MALKINLIVTQTDLLYQQDTQCVVNLHNAGGTTLEVGIPPFDVTLPVVHVVNVQTGAEDVYRKKRQTSAIQHDPVSMAAGAAMDTYFNLQDIVPQLLPGYYDIKVAWEYNNGAELAESQVVRLRVSPTTPKNLHLVQAIGGQSGFAYGVWVNLPGDPEKPCTIVHSSFALMVNGQVADVVPLLDCGSAHLPIMSAPANGAALRSHWIAWIDGQNLHYTHVDGDSGVVAPRQSLPLPVTEDMDIVAPLHGSTKGDSGLPPEGGILLCHGTRGGAGFHLHSIRLELDNAQGMGATTLNGAKPVWIMSHVRSNEQYLATYAQQEGGELSLFLAPWPGSKSSLPDSSLLMKWTCSFLASGATIGAGDAILGAFLVWKTEDDAPRKLVLISWAVSPQNVVETTGELLIDWHPNTPVRDARVGVNDNGEPIALIKDDEGTWHVFDGDILQPVPGEFSKTKQPIEPGFLNGNAEPLLICGTIGYGFKIIQVDGSPLPIARLK